MAYTPSKFHGYLDAKTRAYQVYKPDRGWTTMTVEKHITIQERALSYRFYPHFHPYVAELVRRLIEGSVRGLQAMDTEYQKHYDGTLVTLGTLATLPDGTRVTLPDGTQVTLPDGAQATFPDGTSANLPSGAVLILDGGKFFFEIGIIPGAGYLPVIIPDGARKMLTNSTQVTRPDGTSATFPSGTSVALLGGGKPRPVLYEEIFSSTRYNPSDLVQQPYPAKDLDFTPSAAYGVYNWELFFHVPVTIAIHLSKNQRFEEAMRWFHYIFDPTDDSEGPTPERFWKVKPFQYTDVKLIEDILVNLATGADPALRQETINSIGAWKDSPFRPHVIARYRQPAYMFKTVIAYLDNLIDWGDSLFRQDTGESINEATQLYVLAANILGPRPQAVPKKGSVRPQTYANFKKDLDEFGNVLIEFESDIPFDLAPHPNEAADIDRLTTLRSISNALYFCVPRNDKLLGYWDTVADRLFKIRNSLNILGIFRQLPLFEPPIDPALLARAAAAGLDVGAIVSGANQPLPLVRFQFLVQRAAEICQEVKSLGNNLLSAMEKEDGEAMAILRAKHERIVMEMVEHVRYAQVQEAIKSREGLIQSLALAVQRYTYYERLLGKQENEIKIPELDVLNTDGLLKMKFEAGEPEVASRDIEVDIVQNFGGSGGKLVSSYEREELDKLDDAQTDQEHAIWADTTAKVWRLFPEIGIKFQSFGLGGDSKFGGEDIAEMGRIGADIFRAYAARRTHEGTRAAKIGSYARREQDWAFQSNLAAGEITQIFKQLRAAQIREAIAELELKNHRQQMKHAEEIERFLNEEGTEKTGKKTNKALYAWMKREVKGLYGQVFQFAFDIARKAERALQHELGNPELSFLQFGYLAGKEGLLAGEKLYLDIKRMDMAYHDLNQREYELTKHVSLLQVNPLALLQLRTTGCCTVFLPEELFDMDGPGHYFRRIKSVAVSIPCVVGPYTSVNCTLTLLKSAIRKTQLLREGEGSYAREGAEDDRFSDHFGSLQAIVTSTGQNDSGLFETNLRDERYLPFEGAGVVSEWRVELPKEFRQFDYNTISDVILHFRYTAREGGGLLRNGAVANLKTRIEEAQAAGSVRLFSVRHEFPTEWAKLKSVKIEGDTKTAELTLNLREEHFPFWSKGKLKAVTRADLYAKDSKGTVKTAENADGTGEGTKSPLVKDNSLGGLWSGQLKKLPEVVQDSELGITFKTFKLFFINKDSLEGLWLALTWGKGE